MQQQTHSGERLAVRRARNRVARSAFVGNPSSIGKVLLQVLRKNMLSKPEYEMHTPVENVINYCIDGTLTIND